MRIASFAPLALLILTLAGCSTGQQRTSSTSSAAANTSTLVTTAGIHLDSLTQSMSNLRGAVPGADLKALFKAFGSDSDAVSKSITAVGSSADTTEQKGRTQLEEWNKQTATVQDPDLRAATAKRGGELRTAIEALAASNSSFKKIGAAFTGQIGDIRKVLDLDLTLAGISSIKPTITKAIDSVGGLKGAFNDVAAKSKAITDLLATK